MASGPMPSRCAQSAAASALETLKSPGNGSETRRSQPSRCIVKEMPSSEGTSSSAQASASARPTPKVSVRSAADAASRMRPTWSESRFATAVAHCEKILSLEVK